MNVAFLYVLLTMISFTKAQLPFSPTATLLNDALVDGGCTDCTEITACSTMRISFSGGRFQCTSDGQFTSIEIDPDFGTASTIRSLTSLNTTAFLVGDVGSL